MSEIQAGWVELDLQDKDGSEIKLTLKPTPAAMMAVSRRFNGMDRALSSVRSVDIEALTFIIAHGAGMASDKKAPDRLRDQIFYAGAANVAMSCLHYLAILQNGGRPLSGLSDESEGDEGNG